jgi:methylase of polypeptide subunit release factors
VKVEDEARTIESTIAISPYRGLLLAHDPWAASVPTFLECVPGLAPSPIWLDAFTIRRPVESTLDIGTGSGIQALPAARHSDRVTASDINERAIEFCTFNAQLNDADSITVVQGDLFEAVQGQRFDLIVCNPPYVVSPESQYLYRDGGLEPDGFCHRLVSQMPEHLAEGGYACIVANWPVEGEDDWSDPLRRWIEGRGCDALIILDHRSKPLTYAASMNSDLVDSADAYDHKLGAWTSYYRATGIREIVGGVLIVRRRTTSKNWIDAIAGLPLKGDAGDHLLRMFEGRTHAHGLPRSDLLQLRPCLPDGSEFRERRTVRPGARSEVVRTLRPPAGLQLSEELSELEWELLRRCDGSQTLEDLLGGSGNRGSSAKH